MYTQVYSLYIIYDIKNSVSLEKFLIRKNIKWGSSKIMQPFEKCHKFIFINDQDIVKERNIILWRMNNIIIVNGRIKT